MAFAAWHGWHIQAALLAISNVIVNVYPIMLQRHTRARLAAIRLDRQSRQ